MHMEPSNFETMSMEDRQSHIDRYKNFVRSFQQCWLRSEGETTITTCTRNNGGSISLITKKIKNQSCLAPQETDTSSTGGPSCSSNRGEASRSNAHINRAESSNAETNATRSPIGQSGINSFYNYPSFSNSENQFISNSPFQYNNDPSFMPMRNIDTFGNYRFNENQNGGLYSGYESHTMDYPQIILNCLQIAVEEGDYEEIDRLLLTLQTHMFLLMTDEKMSFVFQKFVDLCEGERLDCVVGELSLRDGSFVNAAFCRQGVISINKLIKKLKWTRHAFTITKILSTRFIEMMTHYTAHDVILKCLNVFGTGPNMILYQEAIMHFSKLATHQVGSRSLSECIDTIPGELRSILLNHISYISGFLSNDPYGNFVVQHVLGLKNDDITCKIVQSLQGEFIELSQKKCGSHVVEKCMKSSNFGLLSVVQEILESPNAAFQLAKNHFGNYVIQRALEYTKERGFTGYHISLIKSLEPYQVALCKSVAGKKVINRLRKLT